MKQAIRILSTLILCIVIFATFSVVAFAALPEADAEPLYENIATGAVTLGFSDNVGTATGVATKKAGTI